MAWSGRLMAFDPLCFVGTNGLGILKWDYLVAEVREG